VNPNAISDGPCCLPCCTAPATGYVAGATPAFLVCAEHTPEVRRTAHYRIRRLPTTRPRKE
jgi:hypothetical protein